MRTCRFDLVLALLLGSLAMAGTALAQDEGDGIFTAGHASSMKGLLNGQKPGALTANRAVCDTSTNSDAETASIELSDGTKPPLQKAHVTELCDTFDDAGVPVIQAGDRLHWEIKNIACSGPNRRCTFDVVSRP
jgi:hypothetical protein